MSLKRTLLFLLPLIMTLQAIANDLYVVNTLGETISYWNGSTTQNNVATLGLFPNDILVKGDTLLALNSGSASLQLFDRNNFSLLSTLNLAEGSNPWAMTLTPNDRVLITNWLANTVTVIDLQSLAIVTEISTGNSPQGVLQVADRIYVTTVSYNSTEYSYGQGQVFVYDAATFAELSVIDVPANPQKMILARDGLLHTLCTGNYWSSFGQIVRIDPALMVNIDTLNIGGSPGDIAEDSQGNVFLAAGGWAYEGIAGQIFSYSVASMELIHGPDNPIQAGQGITNVASQPNTTGVWVSSFESDEVISISATGEILQSLTVGDGPGRLIFSPTEPAVSIDPEQIAQSFRLSSNFPNPFNPTTRIPFQLNQAGHTSLSIVDTRGRLVHSLINADLETGQYELSWNGTTMLGETVPSGIYFAVLSSRSNQSVIKMNLIK